MSDTIFAKIIRREIPADIVYEDDDVIAFKHIAPQAPVHVLFVPKHAVPTLNDLTPENVGMVSKLFLAATGWARAQGFADSGYRCVINCNADGGQTVFHLHVHLVPRFEGDGMNLTWPVKNPPREKLEEYAAKLRGHFQGE